MKYILFDPANCLISVAPKPSSRLTSIRASGWKGHHVQHPLSHRIYFDVLYPAVYAHDRRHGVKMDYYLFPPDPWLVALGLVMWEGIIQGLSWNTIKVSVRTALNTMTDAGVAPSSVEESTNKKTRTELEFNWTEYRDGRKQYHMFVGLRRSYENKKRKKRKKS